MDDSTIFVILLVVGIAAWIFFAKAEREKVAAMSPKERDAYLRQKEIAAKKSAQRLDAMIHGPLNLHIICAQCQTQGTVHTQPIKQKVGISGGKATAAILTGGVSMLATGLSRKQKLTEAWCSKCQSTWHF